MALSQAQAVYPPPAGRATEAPWGVAVAESVIQKFTDTTQRNTRWPQPVSSGSVSATQNDDTLWVSDGTAWHKIAQVAKDVTTAIDTRVAIAGDTMTGHLYVAAGGIRVAKQDQSISIIDASAGYLGFYNGTTVTSYGSRKGYVGFVSYNLYFRNEHASGHVLINPGPSGHLVLGANNVEKARIDTSGRFLVGKTVTDAKSMGSEMTDGTVFSTRNDAAACMYINKQGAAANSGMFSWRIGNVQIGSVHRNASTSAVVYATTSDARWKANVAELDPLVAVDTIKQLRPVAFQWRYDAEGNPTETGEPTGETAHGFLAQELVDVVPLAVSPGYGTEDEHRAWQQRHDEAAALELAYQAALVAHESAVNERIAQEQSAEDLVGPEPPAPIPFEPDPYAPWGSDNSVLMPDVVAALKALIARVEALEAA